MKKVLVLVALALLVGCARIPDAGPVRTIEARAADAGSTVRYEPPGPIRGATPSDVVYGFLDAMLAFPVSTETATEFLTPEAAEAWRPEAGATIYTAPRVSTEGEGDEEARATLSVEVGSALDARGRYTRGETATQRSTWTLRRVSGEWRIANPPDGVLLEQRFFQQAYQPVSLFFLTADSRRLVEDPVFLPAGESLPTSLVTGLLRGPGGLLGGSARTALPESSRLAGPVPLRDDGVAEVDLSGDPAALETRQRELMSAQLVRTLGQVPGVQGVRIDVGAAPLEVPGASRTQPLTAWSELDPPGGRTVGQVFALQGEDLVVVNGSGTDVVASALPDGTAGIADFRIDPRLRRIAVVPTSRDRVVTAALDEQPDLDGPAAYLGADVLTPVWDADERLWVVDRTATGTRLSVVDGTATEPQVRRIPFGPLARAQVEAFALSPDNARFVALARQRGGPAVVWTGEVVSDGTGLVRGVQDVRELPVADIGMGAVRSVAWRSATSVVALGAVGSGSVQYAVLRVDGSTLVGDVLTGDSLLADIGAAQVLGSGEPEAPLYVSDREQRLWVRDEAGRWQRVDSGQLRVPSYPG